MLPFDWCPPCKIDLMTRVAIARVGLFIQQNALLALRELGGDDQALMVADAMIADAEAALHLAEQDLDEGVLLLDELRSTGALPFDPILWRKTCERSVASVGAGATLFADLSVSDTWFRTNIRKIQYANRHIAVSIFSEIKCRSLGLSPFDPVIFAAVCRCASERAAQGCGQSDVLWSKNVTSNIDMFLRHVSNQYLREAECIAAQWGWLTNTEYSQLIDSMGDDGSCSHGLDPDCCPAGCGDIDDGFESWEDYPVDASDGELEPA